jgi:serine/threonine protein kinase/Tol biopolymer transport system component
MNPERWQQVSELYHAAVERQPGDRAELLSQADPELRREVESLLAEHGDGILNRPAIELAANLPDDSTVTQLKAGAMLGPYRIEAPIGAGGMGEVFRALDTRLGRKVALKTCQERFSARFEREARAISSLNHPHICALYDVGPNYLVMELVDGQTLAERLKQGALPMESVLRYGAQISGALAAAQAQDIVHRDLKPGNVMIAKSGVKVLDFGLAKSAQDETLTASHVVMGTPAYMAPEQRAGKECDARTDIYAVGLILYEMASGKRRQSDEPVQLDEFPATFAHVIERCLARDPEDRWQSSRDLQRELEWAANSGAEPPPVPRPQRSAFVPWAVAALAVGLATISFLYFREKPPAPPATVRFQIQLPGNAPAYLSPDGRKLTFIARGRLWVHSLESGESRDLAATTTSGTPFWSPDGRFIGYITEGKLKKIAATGGPPQTVMNFRGNWGCGAWNQDDVIVFGDLQIGLFRVPASGGVPVQITALDPARREGSHYCPSFLPDRRHFVYIRSSTDDANTAIYLGSVDAKPEQQSSKPLVASNSQPVYAPSADPGSGYLLFVREGALMAQPFDDRQLELKGQAEAVAEHISSIRAGSIHVDFSASANGVLTFLPTSASERQVTWYDREGKVMGTVGEPGIYGTYIALSPEGKRLAIIKDRRSDTGSIWLLDVSRGGTGTPFTFGSFTDANPVWSPDASRIVFSSKRNGAFNLYQKPANSVKDEEILFESSADKYPTSWSSDGQFLLYEAVHPKTKRDIWVLPMKGDNKPLPFLITEFDERRARFSPNGHWVAYTSDESGQDEVYVRSFSTNSAGAVEAGGKWPISNGFGVEPRWRGDGRELYYRSRGGVLMAVEIAADTAFRAGKPQSLGTFASGGWDSAPDGNRFITAVSASGPQPVTVVLNWQAGLKK